MIYEPLYIFDDELRAEYGPLLCGCDEAGRGPLAGPVSCAAVILKPEERFEWLNDSKKVSEKRRERLFAEITERALYYKIVFIDNKTIDEINILRASLEGMKRAALSLGVAPSYIAFDGGLAPECGDIPCGCVVRGDARSASIAAASVLAKVARDRFMRELDEKYPQYGFAKHKGYPTKEHYAAIAKHGISEYHRRTFLKGRI